MVVMCCCMARDDHGIVPLCEVFGIDVELVGLLFLDTSYDGEHRRGAAGELAVAERIEQVVKDYQSSN
jgi:hypothetical protein